MTRSVSDRELGEVHLFCHVVTPMHRWISVAELSGGKRIPEHEKKFFDSCQLVKSC